MVAAGSPGEAWRAEGTREAPERVLGCSYSCLRRQEAVSWWPPL